MSDDTKSVIAGRLLERAELGTFKRAPGPRHSSTGFNIIAIPAIGASAEKTWLRPQQDHIWWKVPADVFFFEFRVSKSYKLSDYALQLCKTLIRAQSGGEKRLSSQPIHFAAHSTGGLVLKRALTLSKSDFFRKLLGHIPSSTFSIAFFSTPHYGSTALSAPACEESIQELFEMDQPYGYQLQRELRKPDNVDETVNHNAMFIPLTLQFTHIWSFIETIPYPVKPLMRLSGTQAVEEAKVDALHMLIVDRISATLRSENCYVGCEKPIRVNANHRNITHFGHGAYDERASELYTTELSKDMASFLWERKGQTEIAKKTRVKCLQFYEARKSSRLVIRILDSQNGTRNSGYFLEQLLSEGPASLIGKRTRGLSVKLHNSMNVEEPGSPVDGSEDVQAHNKSDFKTGFPSASVHPSDDTESLASAWDFPEPSKYRFRWTHIPANNMRWVEKVLESVEREIEGFRMKQAKSVKAPSAAVIKHDEGDGTSDKVTDWLKKMVENPLTDPAGPILVSGAQKIQGEKMSTLDTLKNAMRDPAELKRVIIEANPGGDGVSPEKADVDDRREQVAMLRAVNEIGHESKPIQVLEKMTQAAMAPRKEASITGILLTPINWNFNQHEPIHGMPHGRFMASKVGIHAPWLGEDYDLCRRRVIGPDSLLFQGPKSSQRPEVPLGTRSEVLRLFLYFPYLHWDTFGAVQHRHMLLKEKIGKYDDDLIRAISEKDSTEENLIRQYGDSSCALPLHPRRTLDQFNTPDLDSTEVRDADQVIFRWQRDRWHPDSDNIISQQKAVGKYRSMYNAVLAIFRRNTNCLERRGRENGSHEPKQHHSRSRERAHRSRWRLWLLGGHEEENESPGGRTKSQGLEFQKDVDKQGLEAAQKKFKVLMVDQLWCWVLNSDNIVTFFPGRDRQMAQEPGNQSDEDVESQLDLFQSIHDDVNGDDLFHSASRTQCFDCLDFVASMIRHAVKLVLETEDPYKSVPQDLKVFKIFSETISKYKEGSMESFVGFNNTQKEIARCLGPNNNSKESMDSLMSAIQNLGNHEDLTCSINSKDVRDELQILQKLFSQQLSIVKKLIVAYSAIDAANKRDASKEKGAVEIYSHENAIRWLKESEQALNDYQMRVKTMLKADKEVIDNYKDILNLKQKEANVVEAVYARISGDSNRKQQWAMLTFTVVTIFFLPLSFFTSLFGMNVKDWSGDRQNNLRTVGIISGTISAVVIVGALGMAFSTFYSQWWRILTTQRRPGNSGQ